MSCGCGSKQVSDVRQTTMLVCVKCPHGGLDATMCEVTDQPLVRLTYERSCPLDRHPDEQGRVRWLGVKWRGLPRPLRRGLDEFHVPDCGCIDVLKTAVEHASHILTGTLLTLRRTRPMGGSI